MQTEPNQDIDQGEEVKFEQTTKQQHISVRLQITLEKFQEPLVASRILLDDQEIKTGFVFSLGNVTVSTADILHLSSTIATLSARLDNNLNQLQQPSLNTEKVAQIDTEPEQP